MKDFIERQFWLFAIWLIRRGYGPCIDLSLEERERECFGCRAGYAVDWIKGHIRLIKRDYDSGSIIEYD